MHLVHFNPRFNLRDGRFSCICVCISVAQNSNMFDQNYTDVAKSVKSLIDTCLHCDLGKIMRVAKAGGYEKAELRRVFYKTVP